MSKKRQQQAPFGAVMKCLHLQANAQEFRAMVEGMPELTTQITTLGPGSKYARSCQTQHAAPGSGSSR